MAGMPAWTARFLKAARRTDIGSAWATSASEPGKSRSLTTSIRSSAVPRAGMDVLTVSPWDGPALRRKRRARKVPLRERRPRLFSLRLRLGVRHDDEVVHHVGGAGDG